MLIQKIQGLKAGMVSDLVSVSTTISAFLYEIL